MNITDNDPLHAAIDARLASLFANRPTPPAWAGPWRRLGPESTDKQRLDVYRAIRSSGSLPEDAGLYLVSWQIDALASRHAEQAIDRSPASVGPEASPSPAYQADRSVVGGELISSAADTQ
jgi:hypothetical protein